MIFTDHQRQFGFPESDDPGRLLFFIPVDPQVDPGCKAIEILRHLTLRIECFGIPQIVDQFGELTRHFIRISSRMILILFPLINIFFNKETFSHWKNLALYLHPAPEGARNPEEAGSLWHIKYSE